MPTTLLNHFKEIESNLKGQKYIFRWHVSLGRYLLE